MRYVFDVWNLASKAIDVLFVASVPYFVFRKEGGLRYSNGWILFALLIMTVVAYGADFAFYPVPMWTTMLLMIALGMMFSTLLRRGLFSMKIMLVGASVSVCILMHYLSGFFLMRLGYKLFSFQMTILPVGLYIPLAFFLIRCACIPSSRLPARYGVSMSIFMLMVTMCVSVGSSEIFQGLGQTLQLLTYLLVLSIILFMYFLYFSIVREYERRVEYELIAQNVDTQNRHLREIKQLYDEMRELRHEQKNHIFYMNTLIQQKRYDELEEYFGEVFRKDAGYELFHTGSDAIDAVVSQKHAYAKSRKIPMRVQIMLPEEMTIHEGKLCAVIANLLDNAIEASMTVDKPDIAFSIRTTGKYLHVMTRNRVTQDIDKTNPNLKTTKKKGIHGLGLSVIRSIVEEYNGMMEHHMEDENFVVSLMMLMPDQEGV